MPSETLVREIMSSPATCFGPSTDLLEAAATLFDNNWAGAPVLDGEELVGVITLTDLVELRRTVHTPAAFILFDALLYLGSRRFEKELKKVSAMTVGEAMTKNPRTVGPNEPVSEVASLMADERLTTVPVVEDGRVVGIVGRRDVIALILGRSRGA